MAVNLVRVVKVTHNGKPAETVEFAAEIVNGKVAAWSRNPDVGVGDVSFECETIEPITTEYGPEDCGSGPLTLSGGKVRVTYLGQSHWQHYRVENAGSQWRNYGAPHGTNEIVKVKWVRYYPTA